MKYYLYAFRMALRQRFRSRGGRVFLLLAAVLTAVMLLVPSGERQAVVQVGLVLPEKGGEALESLLLERSSELVTFIPTDEATMDKKILSGHWDCGLVVAEDFEEKLGRLDTDKLLTLKTGPASTVYPLVQETAAACMMELMTPEITRAYLEENGMDTTALEAELKALVNSAQRVSVELQTLGGERMSPLELTDSGTQRILRALIPVFMLVWGLYLTVDLGKWLESDAVARLRCVRSITELLLPQLTAALLPLLLWGSVLLPILGGSIAAIISFLGFTAVVLGMGLVLPRFRALWQGVIVVIPFLVVGCLLLEPVLLDVGALFPSVAPWTAWLPVTLYVRGCNGSSGAVIALLTESALLLALSLLLDRRKPAVG